QAACRNDRKVPDMSVRPEADPAQEDGTRTRPTLILALASARRRELLGRLGIEPARVAATDIDETPRQGERPRDYALRMAREKALATASSAAHVLAGDTVVALGRRILPKAEDEATARRCLEL